MSDGQWALINVAAAAVPTLVSVVGLWWASRYNKQANRRAEREFGAWLAAKRRE